MDNEGVVEQKVRYAWRDAHVSALRAVSQDREVTKAQDAVERYRSKAQDPGRSTNAIYQRLIELLRAENLARPPWSRELHQMAKGSRVRRPVAAPKAAPAASPASTSPTAPSLAARLVALTDLHTQGVLDDGMYVAAVRRLLAREDARS